MYNKKLSTSLKPEHYKKLIDAYVLSIKILWKYLQKPNIYTFFEIFEYEWKKFVFADTIEIKKILQNPMILVPVLDESCAKFMPEILKNQENELAILRD